MRGPGDGGPDRGGHGAQAGDRGQDGGARRGGVGQAGQGVGGGGQHAVADPAGPSHGDPEPQAGEDERVVGLGELVVDAVVGYRPERTAGRDERPPAGPGDQVGGFSLGMRGRVGQRHDDRPFGMRSHLSDDRLGEDPGLTRGPDQHSGAAAGHDLS